MRRAIRDGAWLRFDTFAPCRFWGYRCQKAVFRLLRKEAGRRPWASSSSVPPMRDLLVVHEACFDSFGRMAAPTSSPTTRTLEKVQNGANARYGGSTLVTMTDDQARALLEADEKRIAETMR
jgi:hypothetical protein